MEIYFSDLKETEFQTCHWNLDSMKNISASRNWKLKIEFKNLNFELNFKI